MSCQPPNSFSESPTDLNNVPQRDDLSRPSQRSRAATCAAPPGRAATAALAEIGCRRRLVAGRDFQSQVQGVHIIECAEASRRYPLLSPRAIRCPH